MNSTEKLLCSHIDKFLQHYYGVKVPKKGLFQCPFCENHALKSGNATCQVDRRYGYKVKCFDKNCGNLGNIFDLFKKVEPSMSDLSTNEVCDYLADLLDIQTDEEVNKIFVDYYSRGWGLIAMQPYDPSKGADENDKIQKTPIAMQSWKRNISYDINQWKEWYNAGLGFGLVLGKASNLIGVDVDDDLTENKIKDICNKTLEQTSRRGKHRFYKYKETFGHINHSNLRGKGYDMEVRVNASYIIVAPTAINGLKRKWNNVQINEMSEELERFLLDLIEKPKEKEKIVELDDTLNVKNKLKGLDGECNDTFIKLGGRLRKKLSSDGVEWALSSFNKLLDDPMSYKDIKAMKWQIEKYNKCDQKELAEQILKHLTILQCATAKDLRESLKQEKKDIEEALDYLVKEEKVIKQGWKYKVLDKIEWVTDFMDRGKPLNCNVPIFSKYARFREGSLIVIGAKSGRGKTTLSCNLLKDLVDQGIKPYYVPTEAGSNFDLTCATLGLKEGDFWLPPKNKKVDPFNLELKDNVITLIDWLKVTDSNYAMTDTLYERLNDQLTLHGGLVIALAQMKNENDLYAEEMTKHFATLCCKYKWNTIKNERTGEVTYDPNNTYIKTVKIRDSKVGQQYLNIPLSYNDTTKRITARGNNNVS